MEGNTVVNRGAAAAALPAPSVSSYSAPPLYTAPFPVRSKRGVRSLLVGLQNRSRFARHSPAFFFFMLGVAATLFSSHLAARWGLRPQVSCVVPVAAVPQLSKALQAETALLAVQKEEDSGRLSGQTGRRAALEQPEMSAIEEVPLGGGGAPLAPLAREKESLLEPAAGSSQGQDQHPSEEDKTAVDMTDGEPAHSTAEGKEAEAAGADAAASEANGGNHPGRGDDSAASQAGARKEAAPAKEGQETAGADEGGGKAEDAHVGVGQTDSRPEAREAEGAAQRPEEGAAGEELHDGDGSGNGGGPEAPPPALLSLTVFSAPPRPYTEQPSDPQRRALLSWLGLKGFRIRVCLFGRDPSLAQLAKGLPEGAVAVEPEVDANLYGVPQLHSMLARAATAGTDLVMLVAADTVLLTDALSTVVAKATRSFGREFVITGVSWEVGSVPGPPRGAQPAEVGQGGGEEERAVVEHIEAAGQLRTLGRDGTLWLWTTGRAGGGATLVEGPVPPFSYGRGAAEGWLTAALVRQGRRQVVDASSAVFAYRITADPVPKADLKALHSTVPAERRRLWGLRRPQPWEVFANARLAEGPGGNEAAGTASHLHAPWHLLACHEPEAGGVCLVKRARPGNCSCELAPYAPATQTDAQAKGKHFACGVVPPARSAPVNIPAAESEGSPRGLPHRVQDLLPLVANEQKVVVMVGVNFPYADMLMNFVCRLRRLGMPEVLVAAMDEELYRFAFLQGLAVYYESLASSIVGVDQRKCHYGSDCFRKLTKLKSRAVLRVLRLGYNVLWTDVDIMWFRNPLPELLAYGPGTFPVQSNEPNASRDANTHHCINSGFYYARAEPVIVKAFEAVIEHAAKSTGTEQPSFYEVLCGSYGRYRKGADECFWPKHGGLHVMFLPRDLHPNGNYKILWAGGRNKNVTQACEQVGCATLHNNWIIGRAAKELRMRKSGFWFYDPATHLCKYAWTPERVPGAPPGLHPA